MTSRGAISPVGIGAGGRGVLGYPQAALADVDHALKDARDIGQAATLMLALFHASLTYTLCGDYTAADAQSDETVAVANEKGYLQ